MPSPKPIRVKFTLPAGYYSLQCLLSVSLPSVNFAVVAEPPYACGHITISGKDVDRFTFSVDTPSGSDQDFSFLIFHDDVNLAS